MTRLIIITAASFLAEQVMPGAAKGFETGEEQFCIKARCLNRCLNLQTPLKWHNRSVLDQMIKESTNGPIP